MNRPTRESIFFFFLNIAYFENDFSKSVGTFDTRYILLSFSFEREKVKKIKTCFLHSIVIKLHIYINVL